MTRPNFLQLCCIAVLFTVAGLIVRVRDLWDAVGLVEAWRNTKR